MLVFWPRQCILADFVEGIEIVICTYVNSLQYVCTYVHIIMCIYLHYGILVSGDY